MSHRAQRLTHDQVLRVFGRLLADYGWTAHLTVYRTHTGNPVAHPWTGPLAWECRLSTTFQESKGFLEFAEAIRALGLDFQIVGGDEDGAQIRIVQPGDIRITSDD